MIDRPLTHIIRHHREKLSKCSLTPLQGRAELRFHVWRRGFSFDAAGFTVLAVDAPPLTADDAARPLLLLDSTWRLLPDLVSCLTGDPVRRALPHDLRTAYPRKSADGSDPVAGLASVEALYAALAALGHRDDSLLDDYHWRDEFLSQ